MNIRATNYCFLHSSYPTLTELGKVKKTVLDGGQSVKTCSMYSLHNVVVYHRNIGYVDAYFLEMCLLRYAFWDDLERGVFIVENRMCLIYRIIFVRIPYVYKL